MFSGCRLVVCLVILAMSNKVWGVTIGSRCLIKHELHISIVNWIKNLTNYWLNNFEEITFFQAFLKMLHCYYPLSELQLFYQQQCYKKKLTQNDKIFVIIWKFMLSTSWHKTLFMNYLNFISSSQLIKQSSHSTACTKTSFNFFRASKLRDTPITFTCIY